MPKICEFMDIHLFMDFDKNKPPHFVAKYNGHEAVVDINTFGIIEGSLPSMAVGFVAEWAAENQDLLREAWKQASMNKPISKIPVLSGTEL